MKEDIIKREADEALNETSKEKLARFLLDISTDADVMFDQMDEAENDMEFLQTIGGMWNDYFEKEMQNRAKLQFPLINNFIERVKAEWNNSRISSEFQPGDHLETSDKDAELLNSIHRADFQFRGTGKDAIDNAVKEAITCGYGAYQIAERWEDEEDIENERQRMEYRSLYEAYKTVIWDASSQAMNKSDARRVTKLKKYNRLSFLEIWPDEDPVSAYTPNQHSIRSNVNNQQEAVYIATRYEKIKKNAKLWVYRNKTTGQLDFVAGDNEEKQADFKALDFMEKIREREIISHEIHKTVFSGARIFEGPIRVTGDQLPIIALFTNRYYVNGQEWYQGLLRPYKDLQRLYNSVMSRNAEVANSTPVEVPIVTPDQAASEGFDEVWTAPDPAYLTLEPQYDLDDKALPLAQSIAYRKPPQMDDYNARLTTDLPVLAEKMTGGTLQEFINPNNVSGKAIREAKKIQNLNTQPSMDNIASGIEWGGEVYQSKAVEIYDQEQIIRTVGRDGSETTTQLMKVVQDEITGRMTLSNSIQGKKFRAVANVGPQFDTQREETVDTAMKLMETWGQIPAMQPFLPELGGIIIENMAGNDLESIKKMNRQRRLLAGTIDPETDEEKQMVAQAKQKRQQQEQNAQQKLILAATQQQLSEARNLDAASEEKVKSAELKSAQTIKTLVEAQNIRKKTGDQGIFDFAKIQQEQQKIDAQIEKDRFDSLRQIPVGE